MGFLQLAYEGNRRFNQRDKMKEAAFLLKAAN
jgi:hypothetical protein